MIQPLWWCLKSNKFNSVHFYWFTYQDQLHSSSFQKKGSYWNLVLKQCLLYKNYFKTDTLTCFSSAFYTLIETWYLLLIVWLIIIINAIKWIAVSILITSILNHRSNGKLQVLLNVNDKNCNGVKFSLISLSLDA